MNSDPTGADAYGVGQRRPVPLSDLWTRAAGQAAFVPFVEAVGFQQPQAGVLAIAAKVAQAQSFTQKVLAQVNSPAVAAVLRNAARASESLRAAQMATASVAAQVLHVNDFYRQAFSRVMETVARAREALYLGIEQAAHQVRERLREKLGGELQAVLIARAEMDEAASRTNLAMRIYIDRSPPPREALITAARPVRGPNPADRLRLVVVRLRELPMSSSVDKGFPRILGESHVSRPQPVGAA